MGVFIMSGVPETGRVELASTLESVDAAEVRVLAVAQAAGMNEDDLHQLGIAVRESMVNAVVHGNKYSSNKRVGLTVESGAGEIVVIVEDEGDGLDLSSLPDPLAEENLLKPSGRGLLIIRAFVDEVQIEPRSPRGTTVKLVKRWPAS